jgi:hypothetical protein
MLHGSTSSQHAVGPQQPRCLRPAAPKRRQNNDPLQYYDMPAPLKVSKNHPVSRSEAGRPEISIFLGVSEGRNPGCCWQVGSQRIPALKDAVSVMRLCTPSPRLRTQAAAKSLLGKLLSANAGGGSGLEPLPTWLAGGNCLLPLRCLVPKSFS